MIRARVALPHNLHLYPKTGGKPWIIVSKGVTWSNLNFRKIASGREDISDLEAVAGQTGLVSSCLVPGTVLGAGNPGVNKSGRFCPQGGYILGVM